jgi:hypothetical protein
MTTEMTNNMTNNINGCVDVDLDDDLDEVSIPKLVPVTTSTETENNPNSSTPSMPDFSNMDFAKMFESLKSKDPKELTKMIRKMGITDSQIEQMKKQYKPGGMNNGNEETDPRKRLRAKMNEMRMMRGTNTSKKQYMEEMESTGQQPQIVEQVSKKTLANRKKAQKKKAAKQSAKSNGDECENNSDGDGDGNGDNVNKEEVEEIKCY